MSIKPIKSLAIAGVLSMALAAPALAHSGHSHNKPTKVVVVEKPLKKTVKVIKTPAKQVKYKTVQKQNMRNRNVRVVHTHAAPQKVVVVEKHIVRKQPLVNEVVKVATREIVRDILR